MINYRDGQIRLVNCSTLGAVKLNVEDRTVISNTILSGDICFGYASYINSGLIRSRCAIGRYCSIGRGVAIGLGHHDITSFSTSSFFRFQGISSNLAEKAFPMRNDRQRVVIGNDVFIGDGVYILSGVRIGDGAVIGAGAVVTKDVAPYSICVGMPAKHVRNRFCEMTIQSLMNLKWWDKDPNVLQGFVDGSPAEIIRSHQLSDAAYFPVSYKVLRF